MELPLVRVGVALSRHHSRGAGPSLPLNQGVALNRHPSLPLNLAVEQLLVKAEEQLLVKEVEQLPVKAVEVVVLLKVVDGCQIMVTQKE